MGGRGVVNEYRCQPGSIFAAIRASTWPPGGADALSNVSVQCTGSGPAANIAVDQDAAPRNNNARKRDISVSSTRADELFVGELVLDVLVGPPAGEFLGHADRVLDRVGVGAAVGADANAL